MKYRDKQESPFHEAYKGEKVTKKGISFLVEPRVLQLADGPAVLSCTAHDNSVWENLGELHMMVTIDASPPQVFLLTPTTYIKPGGTGMILFRTSKAVNSAGVKVKDNYFPAFSQNLGGKSTYLSYFALPIDASSGTSVSISVRDQGGNENTTAVSYTLLKKKFRHDKLNLSDQFLSTKMADFAASNPALSGKDPMSIFLYVNKEMRLENERTIRNLCQHTEARQLWEGTFLRMKNASPMALFGDQRTYLYQGKEVATSIHQGVDLASTAHAPIEAANNGRIVFVGSLGIYGNTIVIDHGQGIFSLYSHLSNITAQQGAMVKKGDQIGVSGQTGLAAGDHLHFSILVSGVFVDPTEWWDPHWITDNVTKKLDLVR